MRIVALLRGMNVGAHRLPVTRLREVAEALGWRDVRSSVASGNLVATSETPTGSLARELEQALAAAGLPVPVLVFTGPEFRAALDGCPFRPERGKDVHAFFLWTDPVVDARLLDSLCAPSEAFEIVGRVAWMHAPDGIGRSKLADRLHRVLTGTDMTARNLTTVRALADLADETPTRGGTRS